MSKAKFPKNGPKLRGKHGDNTSILKVNCSQMIASDKKLTSKLAICASNASSHGYLRPVMIFLEYSCHGVPWIVGLAFAILLTHEPVLHHKQLNLMLGLFLDLLILFVLKSTIRRKRPSHNQNDMLGTVSVDQYSFPSGHSTRAGLVAVFFCFHFSQGFLINSVLVCWSLAVTVSRVLLGRHHVSDVIIGYLIGLFEYRILEYIWLDKDVCKTIISFIEEDFHL